MLTYFTSCKPQDLSLPRRNLPPPRSLFKSENIFNQFGTFFPSLKHGWGFTAPKKQKKMNDKYLERALDNISTEINDIFIMLKQKIEELENDLIELEEQHEQSLKVAFEKGYEEGVKYTDGLISDEKFPF